MRKPVVLFDHTMQTETTLDRQKLQYRRLIYLRDLIIELVSRNLKLQYKRSALGFIWSLLNPLLQLGVFVLFFQHIFKLSIPHYALNVFIGMLVWNWYSTTLYQAATSITDSADLIRKPGFPASILPVVTVLTQLIQFILALPIAIVFALISGHVGASICALPVLIAMQFVLCLGLSYLCAGLNVLFRDTQHILGVLLLLQFYLTPVFYSDSLVPRMYLALYDLNPMVILVDSYRAVMVMGHWPSLLQLGSFLVLTLVLLFMSHRVFVLLKDQFAEEVS